MKVLSVYVLLRATCSVTIKLIKFIYGLLKQSTPLIIIKLTITTLSKTLAYTEYEEILI